MKKKEFYQYYIPALIKAFENDFFHEDFFIKSPEQYFDYSASVVKELDKYIDSNSGKDDFLDNVAYYFDAKSHNFKKINNITLNEFKYEIQKEIQVIKEKYGI